MSINDIIGPVSIQAATIVIAAAGSITAIAIALIVRRSKREVAQDFELAKMRLENEAANVSAKYEAETKLGLAKIATNKEIEVARIDKHIIDVKPNNRRKTGEE